MKESAVGFVYGLLLGSMIVNGMLLLGCLKIYTEVMKELRQIERWRK